MNPLLDVKNLYVRFKTPDDTVTAVNDLNFTLNAGSTLGIVGESGSGKSSLALAVARLIESEGEIMLRGQNLNHLKEKAFGLAHSRSFLCIYIPKIYKPERLLF